VYWVFITCVFPANGTLLKLPAIQVERSGSWWRNERGGAVLPGLLKTTRSTRRAQTSAAMYVLFHSVKLRRSCEFMLITKPHYNAAI